MFPREPLELLDGGRGRTCAVEERLFFVGGVPRPRDIWRVLRQILVLRLG